MIKQLIAETRAAGGSDLHLTVGEPPVMRVNGKIVRSEHPKLTEQTLLEYTQRLCEESDVAFDEAHNEYDFCYVTPNGMRHRCNIFMQKGCRAIVLRMLNETLPSMESLSLPAIFKEIAMMPRGLVLVTGPTGSGKTTTLAALVDYINETRTDHIITIEDPIEYLHTGKQCIVNQREVGVDVENFAVALRAALREDPDVILVGEMRDLETISAAITASETGHFVMGTLHTTGAAKTIDRIIDVFPPHQQQQVRTQLATVLRAVITQTLLPCADGKGRVPAFEILLVNDAVSNLIRENKTFQINSVIQTNQKSGMVLLDMYLATLVKRGIITQETAKNRAANQEELTRYL